MLSYVRGQLPQDIKEQPVPVDERREMTSPSENTQPENELWLICPVCKEPNPSGTLHCRHCWGASLYSVEPITSRELVEITRRRLLRLKRLNLLRITAVSIIAPLLLSLAVFIGLYNFTDVLSRPPPTLSSSPLPGEWTMFRHDLAHTGSTGLTTTSPQGTLKWEFSTGAPIHSSPAVVDGTVYIGSRDWTLYALDAETGARRWEFKAESWVESSPAVANGVVYFGSNDGRLYALDANTGEKLWDYKTRYPVKSSPAVADGIVYFGSDDYYVYALDAVTGTKLWEFETDSHVTSSPVVANGILYIGSMDGFVYGLHAQNGRFRLRVRPYQPVIASPSVADGVVYFNSAGYLYAIDGNARNWPGEHDFRGWWLQLWAFRLAPQPPPISGFLWRLALGFSSPSSPVMADGTVYTAADTRLYRLDIDKIDFQKLAEMRNPWERYQYLTTESGWVFSAGGKIRSSPALGNNTIYVASEDGRLYAVDTATGRNIWDFTTGGKLTSSPTLVGGTIYVGSHDGKVYAIE